MLVAVSIVAVRSIPTDGSMTASAIAFGFEIVLSITDGFAFTVPATIVGSMTVPAITDGSVIEAAGSDIVPSRTFASIAVVARSSIEPAAIDGPATVLEAKVGSVTVPPMPV